jgi:hypothetical protein
VNVTQTELVVMLFFLAIFSNIANNRQRYSKVSPIIDSDTDEKSIADTDIDTSA